MWTITLTSMELKTTQTELTSEESKIGIAKYLFAYIA